MIWEKLFALYLLKSNNSKYGLTEEEIAFIESMIKPM